MSGLIHVILPRFLYNLIPGREERAAAVRDSLYIIGRIEPFIFDHRTEADILGEDSNS